MGGVTLGEQHPAPDAGDGEGSATDEAGTAAPDAAQPDPDGNLDGLEVCVELSLNGQNFTEDRIYFTYYGRLRTEAMQVVALPEGMVVEPPKEDPKAKKPAKGAVEEPVETVVKPGSKLGCAVAPILQSTFSTIRVELFTKVEGEELQPFAASPTIDLPAKAEMITPPPPPPPPVDPKDKNPPPEV